MLLFSPPALRATPLVNAGGKAPFTLLVGAGQCPAHNRQDFDCLRQCAFAPKIAGRGIAPPLQWVRKPTKLTCHCEARSAVEIRALGKVEKNGQKFGEVARGIWEKCE